MTDQRVLTWPPPQPPGRPASANMPSPQPRCRTCDGPLDSRPNADTQRCRQCQAGMVRGVVGDWWYEGNCKLPDEATPEEIQARWRIFFLQLGESASLAKGLCNGLSAAKAAELGLPPKEVPECPVREECGAYARANLIEHGIWGGMNTRERRAIEIQRRNGEQVYAGQERAS